MYHALTQGIRTIKTFIKYKSATSGKFITKKTQVSSVEYWDHNNQLNQRYSVSTTPILQKISNFSCKIEVFEKIKLFFCI